MTVLVTGYEGRGQGIYSDLGNFLVGGVLWMVVLFSFIGGETGFWGTGLWGEKGVSSGGICGNIQLKLNGDLHKYIKHSEERSKMMSLLLQIHHVKNGICHLLKLLSHLNSPLFLLTTYFFFHL